MYPFPSSTVLAFMALFGFCFSYCKIQREDLDSLGSAIFHLNLDTNLKMQTPKLGLGRLGEGSLDSYPVRASQKFYLKSSLGTSGYNLQSSLGLQILCNGGTDAIL